MFTVTMFSFTKRANSTAQPSGGTSFNCILKSDSSILTPTIELQLPITQAPNYNYAYIPAYGRYYYVKDWLFTNRLWVASLSVDVLATYKKQIGDSALYVTRSSATYDGRIIDTMYPAKTSYTSSAIVNAPPFPRNWSQGSFILGLISGSSSTGAVAYYVMTKAQFASFASAIFTDGNFDSITDITQALWRTLFNPIQYVSRCLWVPIAFDDFSGADETRIKFGWWDMNINCRDMGEIYITKTMTLAIPHHPQAASRGEYLNSGAYSRYKLHALPFGDFALDGMLLSPYTALKLTFTLDPTTGVCNMRATGDSDSLVLLSTSAKLGVDIPLASLQSNLSGAFSGTATAVASGGAGNILGSQAGILSAIGSLLPQTEGGGVQGSAALIGEGGYILQGEFFDIADEDNAHFGRPLMSKRTLSALPGFLQVQDGDVPINGTAAEFEQIKSYLEGGFYYE